MQVDAFTQVSKDMLTGRLYLSANGEVGEQHHGYGICVGSRSETEGLCRYCWAEQWKCGEGKRG